MTRIETIQRAVNFAKVRIQKKLASRKRLNKIESAAISGKGYYILDRLVFVYDLNYKTKKVESYPLTSFAI